MTLKCPPISARFSKPSKEDNLFKEEEEEVALNSKSPPIFFKPLKPLKEVREDKEEEEEAMTLKCPPISARFCNPSHEAITPS